MNRETSAPQVRPNSVRVTVEYLDGTTHTYASQIFSQGEHELTFTIPPRVTHVPLVNVRMWWIVDDL